MRDEQRARRCNAIVPDPDRQRVSGKQQRFVAHDGGIVSRHDGARRIVAPTVPAADDPRMPACMLERGRERACQRCLARTSGEDTSDDDHRRANRRAAQQPRAIRDPAQRDNGAKKQ